MDISLSDVKKEKETMEKNIMGLLIDFYDKTGFFVDEVTIKLTDIYPDGKRKYVNVKCNVDL